MSKDYGVLWQLKQNIESKKLLIKAADEDMKRANERRNIALADLKEYEIAVEILEPVLTKK